MEIELQYREQFASNAVRLLEATRQVFEDASACAPRPG